jgi:hypothetical protein
MLPLLDSGGAKMSRLEEVIGGQLEAQGQVLAHAVAGHVLVCFRSRDPQVSLEPVVQGPAEEPEDAAYAGVEDAARVVAKWFKHQPEDV